MGLECLVQRRLERRLHPELRAGLDQRGRRCRHRRRVRRDTGAAGRGERAGRARFEVGRGDLERRLRVALDHERLERGAELGQERVLVRQLVTASRERGRGVGLGQPEPARSRPRAASVEPGPGASFNRGRVQPRPGQVLLRPRGREQLVRVCYSRQPPARESPRRPGPWRPSRRPAQLGQERGRDLYTTSASTVLALATSVGATCAASIRVRIAVTASPSSALIATASCPGARRVVELPAGTGTVLATKICTPLC